MDISQSQIVSFIWGIADDCLRDVFVRGQYRDVILPMVVLRRFDALLEPTKEQVEQEIATSLLPRCLMALPFEGTTNQLRRTNKGTFAYNFVAKPRQNL